MAAPDNDAPPPLEALLSDPLLDPEAAIGFRDQCERIAARHAGWRRNFPAFAVLLETEEEKAHALAGNYATEGRETVGAWLAAQATQGGDWVRRRPVQQLQDWPDRYLDAWREQVLLTADFQGLDGSARERFLLILDDLIERGRQESAAHVAREVAGAKSSGGMLAVVLLPFAAVGRAIWRFFDPRTG